MTFVSRGQLHAFNPFCNACFACRANWLLTPLINGCVVVDTDQWSPVAGWSYGVCGDELPVDRCNYRLQVCVGFCCKVILLETMPPGPGTVAL